MDQIEQKAAAKAFVERWMAAEGSEDRESDNFWIELCGELLEIPNPTYVLDRQRKVRGRRIDIFYEDRGILIENKSRGISLDAPEQRGWTGTGKNKRPRMITPYEQARWYADNIVPRSIAPRWILTCNFDEIRIYDTNNEYPENSFETISLEDLPDLLHRLRFFTSKEESRLEREKELSVQAGEVVGRLYDRLASRYHNIEHNKDEQRALNILITRIVFLLYAEDALLLNEHQGFYRYLEGFSVEGIAGALKDLFLVLNTPEDERGNLYVNEKALAFPYINGGLFEEDIPIPPFDDNARVTLLLEASAEFDWARISPTIFGAVFESTLNPETRRAGGMHYTSVENIHKVIDPLFLDSLKAELVDIEGERVLRDRERYLIDFQHKLASISILENTR